MKTIFTLIEAAVLPADTDINAPQKERDKGCSASYRDLGTSYDNERQSRAGLSKSGRALLKGLQARQRRRLLKFELLCDTENGVAQDRKEPPALRKSLRYG